MTFWTLIRRSLRFHARAHFGVAIGAAIGSAALTGALVVGDSVHGSLRARARARVGKADYLLPGRDRLFTDSSNTWTAAFGDSCAVGLQVMAVASAKDGAARANQVNLYGVEPAFFRFAPAPMNVVIAPESVCLNQALATQLGVATGDTVLLRFRKPSVFSSDSALSPRSANSQALRLMVQSVLTPEQFGEFSPAARATPPLNAFVRLPELQRAAELADRANFVLEPSASGLPTASQPAESPASLADRLAATWSAHDAELDFVVLSPPDAVELRSKRVFLDPPIVEATRHLPEGLTRPTTNATSSTTAGAVTNQTLILTYLVNLLRNTASSSATPYSMVCAAGAPFTPADMQDDEVVVSRWLADDLEVKPGDKIELTWFLPDSGARLTEGTNSFRVRSIVPLEAPWADRALMPDFPGIEKAESTSDWDAGFPLVHKIRPKDEDYWRKYRGTPKAFVTLAAGQKMWGNRFGDLTSIRFAVPPSIPAAEFQRSLEKSVLRLVRPEQLGLQFEPIRQLALRAADQAQDFGQLFLGFSVFLVVAGLLLMALLFQFGLEQRATEVGTLLALGFTARQVRRWLWLEGGALGLAGGLAGLAGGLAYAKVMLLGLATVWRDAVGTSTLHFHVSLTTLLIGLCSSTAVAVVTIGVTLRKQARQPARVLLTSDLDPLVLAQGSKSTARGRGNWIGLAATVGAAATLAWAFVSGERSNAEAFFCAGGLLLIAGLGFTAAWFGSLARRSTSTRPTLAGLGVRGCVRRRSRSQATVALLACGCFLIVAIGVFRLDANQDGSRRTSGTGGFALIGQSTVPVVHDLNSQAGREFFGLNPEELRGVSVVSLRVREGDEASCLNLNRAQQPRLLGVNSEALAGRFTFAGVAKGLDPNAGWRLLNQPQPRSPEEIPAIGDANSIQWALGKKLGDTIDYIDERGTHFKLRLVAGVANSILQGSLLIDQAAFMKRFPGESGYRMFLLDAPSNSVARVSTTLSRALQDSGMQLTPAVQRLNAFNAVQNTYLGTFQVLGGLGLLLGSAGLGLVVLRNVLERRGELGLLVAVGFRRRALEKLVLSEHGALLGLGLALGIIAAAVAVLPAVLSPTTQLPYLSLATTLSAILLNGLLWTWLATRYALRGNLLEALRNE